MKQNIKSTFANSAKFGFAAVVCASALVFNSTASAVVVDGVFNPSDNYQNVAPLTFQLQNGSLVHDQGTLAWSVGANGNVFVAFVQPLSINDNTYGTNAIGWGTKSHTFGDLTGSDKAHFDFTNGAGQSVLSFDLDYLTKSTAAASGYKSLGVTGGDGKVTLGNASSVLSWGTSLDYNLNHIASQYTTNSPSAAPALNPDGSIDYSRPYTNSQAPGWVYSIQYEVEISAAAFGASGFGGVVVPYAHNSPSKFGENTIPIVPVPEPATYIGGLALIAFLVAAHAKAVRKKAQI